MFIPMEHRKISTSKDKYGVFEILEWGKFGVFFLEVFFHVKSFVEA